MILSAHSSAEEMVASVTVNDPGKHFPILRKTIQLIQSLFKKWETKGDLSKKKKKEENRLNTKKMKFQKERDKKNIFTQEIERPLSS